MDALKSPLFIVCSILFLVHQLLQHILKVNFTWADAYLDNLLAMPVILPLLVAERRMIFRRGAAYRLTILEALIATLYISLISELLFPSLSTRFTFDWIDFIFFFAGAAVYLLVEYEDAEPAIQTPKQP